MSKQPKKGPRRKSISDRRKRRQIAKGLRRLWLDVMNVDMEGTEK